MTIEDFRNLMQGVQAGLLGSAVLIGGAWALYRFRSLLSIDRAKVELDKVVTELEQARRELESRPWIEIGIKATQMGDFSNSAFICARIELKNVGNSIENIQWEKSHVNAAPILGNLDDGFSLGTPLKGYRFQIIGKTEYSLFAPGEAGIFEFLIPAPKSGIYLIDASLAASSISSSQALDKTGEERGLGHLLASWRKCIYYEVHDNNVKRNSSNTE